MEFHFERRESASARWAGRVSTFSLVLLLTAVAGHRFGMVETIPFFRVLALVAALAVLALLLAAVGFVRLWVAGDKGGRAATRATLVALLVLLPFGFAGFQAYTLPRLVDVSTDVEMPPDFVTAAGRRSPGANPIRPISREDAAAQAVAYPHLTGRRYQQPVDRLVEIVTDVIADLGWTVQYGSAAESNRGESRIEALAPSLIAGLLSDVVMRIVDEEETTYVDMRSASRYGVHDLGDNAAKIIRFLDALDAEVALRNMPVNVEE